MQHGSSIIGLVGEHIENSFSPYIHRSFIRYYSLNYCYFPFPVSAGDLETAIMGARVLGIRGLNVTLPFKTQSMGLMDVIDPVAEKIGAINTIVREDKKWIGYNTDWLGFVLPLEKENSICLSGRNAVVLGAGGAARAVTFALAKKGCSRISVINRTPGNALELKRNVEGLFPHCVIDIFSFQDQEIQKEIEQADLIINTTPLGCWYYPGQDPLPKEIRLPSKVLVYDLIYDPDRTPLLKRAEENGNKVLNGKPMLVYQAAESFYLWTGIRPEQGIISQILSEMEKNLRKFKEKK